LPTWLIWTLGLGIPLTAAAVPIIIHLINLTRYRKVDWAAMEFLLAAYRKTRRRLQMESLIMLLLRVLAIMLIAAALFPMGCERVKAWADDALGITRGTLNTDAPLHLVLVLDNSASMGYKQENQTAFDRAKQFALATVDGLQPNRDRVSVVRLSDVYVPPGLGGAVTNDVDADKSRRRRVGQMSSLNLEAARREIAATGIAAVDTNMLAALRESARLVEGTPESDASGLVVISDFCSAGWRELSLDGTVHADFQDVMARISARMETSGTTPVLYDAGFDNTQNIAITDVRVNERIIGEGMEATVLIDLAYFSSDDRAPVRNVRLKYRVDGGTDRPFAEMISLLPNERRNSIELKLKERELALKPEDREAGGASRTVEVFTEEPDALVADNTRTHVIHVVPGVPILVVNGARSTSVGLDETFYLETALSIASSRIESEAREGEEVRITPNRIISIEPEELAAVDSFFDYRMVVLANVGDLNENVVRKLEEFVKAGFGLLIFDGNQVDAGLYNERLYKNGKGLLPARLGGLGGSEDHAAEHKGLTITGPDHPIMRIFFEEPQNRPIVTEPEVVRQWRELKLPEGAEVDPLRPVLTILSLNLAPDPAPFMVERRFGRGSVIYVSTSASQSWNSMWTAYGLPLFLYLEVATYLTGNEARYSNLAVGEPYRRILRTVDIAPRYSVRDPANTMLDIVSTRDQDLDLLEFAGTAQPGVYTLTAFEKTPDGADKRKWQERFSVSLQARESDVTRITPQQAEGENRTVEQAIKEAMGELPFLYRQAGDELEGGGALTGDHGGREWMWLAVLGVCFLLFETLWSGVISKPEQ
jgi:hypothetical protein